MSSSRSSSDSNLLSTPCVAQMLEPRRLLSVSFAPAPYTTPANTPDVALGMAASPLPPEPFVRINPTNPSNLHVASQYVERAITGGGSTIGTERSFPLPQDSNTRAGRAGLAFDSLGDAYWVNATANVTGIAVSRIPGGTGTPGSAKTVTLGGVANDKPFIAADASPSSPFVDNLYVAWTRTTPSSAIEIYFSRSINHATSFAAPLTLSNAATEGAAGPASVAVAPNGDVYVTYYSAGVNFGGGHTLVRRSTDGGASFGPATEAFTIGNSDVTKNVAFAGGNIPGATFWTRGTVQPWVLPDPLHPGNVYVVTADDPNDIFGSGDDANVVIARSTNNGGTWQRSTVSSGPNNSFQLFPTAAIDKFGNLVIAWYDNRRGLTNASGNYKLDVYATYSTDDGQTFASEFMVNDPGNPFDPDAGAATGGSVPPATTWIGDYFGIDLFGNTAYVAWNGNSPNANNPTGQQVWLSTFTVAGALTINGADGVVNDTITLRALPANPSYFEVVHASIPVYAGLRSGISQIRIDGLAGNDTIILMSADSIGIPTILDGGAGDDGISVLGASGLTPATNPTLIGGGGTDSIGLSASTLTINADLGASGSSMTLQLSNNSNVTFTTSQHLRSLDFGFASRATLQAGGNLALVTRNITYSSTGTLDLNDNDAILDYTGASPIAEVQTRIRTARNSGAWNFPGISSSSAKINPAHNTTLGTMEATDFKTIYGANATFAGQAIDDSAVLIKYTYYGDADFNGIVNFDDYSRTSFGYHTGLTGWLNGDYDGSGIVNFDDFSLMDNSFNTQAGALRIHGSRTGKWPGAPVRTG